jgi:hypothetical protein
VGRGQAGKSTHKIKLQAMSTLYGIKPEPMSLEHQVVMGMLYISAQLQQGQEKTYIGPPLSEKQQQEHLPGYVTEKVITFQVSYDKDNNQVVFALVEEGNPEPLACSTDNIGMTEMKLLSSGASIAPLTKTAKQKLKLG